MVGTGGETDGEALLRIRAVENEHGMEAYRRSRGFCGSQIDMGLVELRQNVLRPHQAKHEEDMAKRSEEWAGKP